jgi:predicted transposase YbfD/YdcC
VCSSPPTRCTAKKTFLAAAATGNALLVRVKDNQPRSLESLAGLCAAQLPTDHLDAVDRHAHGREEYRRVEVFAAADRLDPDWQPFIACVVRVTRRTLCRDTRTGLWPQRREVAYYACQAPLGAKACAGAIRGHWGIENRDHHVRDRTLGEDASRIRRRPGVFARLRSFALNILRANGVGNVSEALYTNALSLDRLLAHGLPKSQN